MYTVGKHQDIVVASVYVSNDRIRDGKLSHQFWFSKPKKIVIINRQRIAMQNYQLLDLRQYRSLKRISA